VPFSCVFLNLKGLFGCVTCIDIKTYILVINLAVNCKKNFATRAGRVILFSVVYDCVFICLFVCQHDNFRTVRDVSTKFSG